MTELEKEQITDRLKPKKSIDEKSLGSMSGHKYSIKDFKIIRSLGKGSYGEVFVAKSKIDKRQYAVKMISKNDLEKVASASVQVHKHMEAMSEKEFLRIIKSPRVPPLHHCFQDPQFLYYVTEYCNGGNLLEYLSAESTKSLTQRCCRYSRCGNIPQR